jgi:hypothetical protein
MRLAGRIDDGELAFSHNTSENPSQQHWRTFGALYSIEMLIQMAISRQRVCKIAKTLNTYVKHTSMAIASQPHLC